LRRRVFSGLRKRSFASWLGEGAASLLESQVHEIAQQRPRNPERVYAEVLVEPRIFGGDDRLDEGRRNVAEIDENSLLPPNW
jgi:hypothetical protein